MSLKSEIAELRQLNGRLISENEQTKVRILELGNQKKVNSKNSSKSPSSDYKANLTLRTKNDKKPGGQKGHKGYNLPMSDNPDEVIPLRADTCSGCGTSLAEVKPEKVIRRQMVDLSNQKPLKITEYRSEILDCPSCGKKNGGNFPSHLKSSMEYGPNISGLLMLMVHTHALPYNRTAGLVQEIFGAKISPGTIVNITKACAKASAEPVEKILRVIKCSPVLQDETGIRVAGMIMWGHTACTANDRHLFFSESRVQKE